MNNLINTVVLNKKGDQFKVVKINSLFEIIIMIELYRVDRKKKYKITTLNKFNNNYRKW